MQKRDYWFGVLTLCLSFTLVSVGVAQNRQLLTEDVDIGILPEEDRIPEGKADVLVVLSAKWCRPCMLMKPQWRLMKRQGYDIMIVDVDDPTTGNEDRLELANKYHRIYVEGEKTVPQVFWYNSQTKETVKQHKYGMVTMRQVKKTLWKKSSSKDSVPVR